MSLLAQSAWGIDVSDGTLKAVRLTRRGRRITLRRAERQTIDGGEDPEAAADALADFVRRVPLGTQARVVISCPTRGVFSRTYMIPTMDTTKVEEMVRYEVLSEVGVPPDDVLVRHHVRKGVAEQEVHAYALRARLVQAWRALLAERRIGYDALETPGFALASFIELEMPLGRDRILLAVGRHATELVLLAESGLWMRHLPLGLASLPDNESLAARLKNEIGAAIGAFLPSDRPYTPHDLVLTEEGALDAGFTGALRKATGLTVTRVQTLQRIQAARSLNRDAERTLTMGKALGLALSGLELGRFRSPVVQGDARREAQRLVPRMAAGVLLASAGLVGFGEAAAHKTATLDAVIAPRLADDVLELAGERARLLDERQSLQSVSDALLAVAKSRSAVFAPRRALKPLAALVSDPALRDAHVERLWVSPPTRARAGVLTVVLLCRPELDTVMPERLEAALRADFGPATVRGPETGASPGRSRFVLEVALP